ncbi:IS66 family insertion sequence element accessory protein TnpB [Pseudomonas sp. ADAK13]|uniref:IS66 family insertion sequence element accessory protein TnpB n=1 Tax=Pseudomonas sp. ADAK13 TaxID=2730847 RepID=UPI003FA7445F
MTNFGIWLVARRLNQGKFHWPGIRHGSEMELDTEQLQARRKECIPTTGSAYVDGGASCLRL